MSSDKPKTLVFREWNSDLNDMKQVPFSQTNLTSPKEISKKDLKKIFQKEIYSIKVGDKILFPTEDGKFEFNPGESLTAIVQSFSISLQKVYSALLCSAAAYEDSPCEFFNEKLKTANEHNFRTVLHGRYANSPFCMVEDKSTLFVSFRGTVDFDDVLTDGKFSESRLFKGRCHHGNSFFLKKKEKNVEYKTKKVS
jgi:hypothetical protein